MEIKGCFNCSHKKNLDKFYYKCTESRSQPNIEGLNTKFTGFIRETKTPILPNHYLGCSCVYWNPDKTIPEKVEFT